MLETNNRFDKYNDPLIEESSLWADTELDEELHVILTTLIYNSLKKFDRKQYKVWAEKCKKNLLIGYSKK